MELYRFSNRIYYSSYEEQRDRPSLGYIYGDNFSVAVDAGHSDNHLKEFYDLLNQNNLPLPSLTILTHWHWDHSFALHAINGLSICNKKTNNYLKEFISKRNKESDKEFLSLDKSISLEYKDNKEIIVVPCDIEFEDHMNINAGNIEINIFESISPHTDDASLIYIPSEKIVFFGDAMSGVFPTWIADKKLTDEFYKTIDSLDVEYCIGGHWDIFTKQELLDELRNRD